MEIWKSLGGMLGLELTCAEPERIIGHLSSQGIELYALEQVSLLTCRFRIRRRDWKNASGVCEKNGGELKVIRQHGLYWTGRSLVGRPVLLLGMTMILFLCFFIPTRIFFVEVEGNESIPNREIVAAAENCGICFGASRRDVRSEQVKNALLSALPQLKWAGVNTRGCVAVISVREGTTEEKQEETSALTRVEAARDGYVLSATAIKGNLLVQPGQTVKAGQTLISGYLDCGICIRITGAEGEILAQTIRELEAIMPAADHIQEEAGLMGKKYSLLLGKKRINLWKDSGISVGRCGRMYKEYYITLPGGFQLPLGLCVERYVPYRIQPGNGDMERNSRQLTAYTQAYLTAQMHGGEILRASENFDSDTNVLRLTGSYVCREMIGRIRQEQIGDTNGENS